MDWINQIISITEWSELAGIAAISVLLFNLIKLVFVKLYQKIQVSKLISARHKISMIIESKPDDDISLAYITYFKKGFTNSFTFGKWERYKVVPVSGNSNIYTVDKNVLLNNCRSIRSSYNFILNIPNTDSAKEFYFAKLAFQGFVITGQGDAHETDPIRWLIYFIHPDEPFHVDSGYSWELKNSFIE